MTLSHLVSIGASPPRAYPPACRARVVLATLCLVGFADRAAALDRDVVTVDLRPQRDSQRVLENPDKGWYHHFYDNCLDKYLGADEDLLAIPGMDHVYLRLAWSYLEPSEGRYDWSPIDDAVQRFTRLGLGVAMRISCREPNGEQSEQRFATPGWVRDAGADGDFYRDGERVGPDGHWEPRYDDPVFLEKLAAFLAAFGERYDGAPWLRYVDIGSLGDWGEGHTHFGSRQRYGYEVRRRHAQLLRRSLPDTLLCVTDDYVAQLRESDEIDRLHQELVRDGFTYRDDSILVDWYVKTIGGRWSVDRPDFFEAVYRSRPTVLELEHYHTVVAQGNWTAEPAASISESRPGATGADFFRKGIDLLRATYIGYHGDAKRWLADNPELTGELLNRCGYWFFLDEVTAPATSRAGDTITIRMAWSNDGVAPAYKRYDLQLRLCGAEGDWARSLADIDVRSWAPGATANELARVTIPVETPAGIYRLGLRLRCPESGRPVEIGLDAALRDASGYYEVADLRVVSR